MSDNLITKTLETEDDKIGFEQGLFKAFKNNMWILSHYEKPEEKRLRPYFSYDDLLVIIAKKGDNIISAMAYHMNTNNKFQLEDMGFKLPEESKSKKYCEGLVVYTDRVNCEHPLEVAVELISAGKKEMARRGIELIYGTCTDSLFRMYKNLGWEKVDELTLEDGTKKFLMKQYFGNDIFTRNKNLK